MVSLQRDRRARGAHDPGVRLSVDRRRAARHALRRPHLALGPRGLPRAGAAAPRARRRGAVPRLLARARRRDRGGRPQGGRERPPLAPARLLAVEIRREQDVVLARQRARQVARAPRIRRRRTRRGSPPRSPRSRATPGSTRAAATGGVLGRSRRARARAGPGERPGGRASRTCEAVLEGRYVSPTGHGARDDRAPAAGGPVRGRVGARAAPPSRWRRRCRAAAASGTGGPRPDRGRARAHARRSDPSTSSGAEPGAPPRARGAARRARGARRAQPASWRTRTEAWSPSTPSWTRRPTTSGGRRR